MRKQLLFLAIFLAVFNLYSQEEKPIVVKKLPVNTILSEITTQVRGDYLYVYRNTPFYKTHSEYYDLYKIKVNRDEVLSKFTKLENNLNTRFNEGPVSFDNKNKLVYVTRNVYNKAQMKLKNLSVNPLEIDIYREVGDTFIFEKKFPYNDSSISVGHACYSDLTHRLYFSSESKEKNEGGRAKGGADLFYCDVLADGSYGKPVNLGKKINTKADELFTVVNRGVLFFSTAGFQKGSRKDLDIYYISEMGLLNGEKPKRLEEPINSNQDDFGIAFIDGQRGYFSSNRDNSRDYNHDVYYFDLMSPITGDDEFLLLLATQDKRLEKLTDDNFKVINENTNEELLKTVSDEGIVVEKMHENETYLVVFNPELNLVDVKIGPYRKLNPDDVFLKDTIILEDKNIEIALKEEDTASVLTTIDQMKDWFAKNEEKVKKQKVDSTKEITSSFSLNNIYFDYNKYKISSTSSEILNTLAEYLQLNTKVKLKIFAHTDSRGSDKFNNYLSQQRANEVFEYLISKGVPEERIIEVKGLGKTQLIEKCEDCTDAQHEKNRRVEFGIVN